MDTLDTDILILGAGGAGLFAALHAKKARPELDVTIAVKGLLGKCGCTRMVQGGYNVALAPTDSVERHFMDTDRGRRLAQPAGAGVAPGRHRADSHPRAGERDRLLLRPQSRRHRASEGVRRADLRPHRAQGRSHRHRDRQPAVRADLAARRAAAGGSPRARSDSGGGRLGPRRRLHARHAHRRAADGARARDPARDRRRADHVSLSHAVRRQVVRRHGDGAARRACRFATWRWCSSIRPDCWPGPARA